MVIPQSYVPTDTTDLLRCCKDPVWRLGSGHLYWIMTKDDENQPGAVMRFRPNAAQRDMISRLHHRTVILKARQLGFSTAIAIIWLDHALFTPDQRCGIIAHHVDDAKLIFRDKIRFAYDRLPEALRTMMPLARESADELLFGHNNSSIRVSTSMRSGTIHRLHVSEMGKIAAKYPEKAQEIVSGSLPAVPSAGCAVIESTAEGQEGHFYEIATRAEARSQHDRPLSREEWAFLFYPWHSNPEYRADPASAVISAEEHTYFARVEAETGVEISLPQRAWYVLKRDHELGGDMDLMRREYPSTSRECWQRSIAGAYYATRIALARSQGRIARIPHVENVPVHTFWDIGSGDGTGIWLMQHIAGQHRFLRYIEGWGEGYSHYVRLLRETGWVFGVHHLPHDAGHERQLQHRVGKPIDMLRDLAPDWRWEIVPRVSDLTHGIILTASKLGEAFFDEAGCKEGITHIELYRRKWNARVGAWSDEPEKLEGHSEAADAIRQWAQGFTPLAAAAIRPRRRRVGAMAL